MLSCSALLCSALLSGSALLSCSPALRLTTPQAGNYENDDDQKTNDENENDDDQKTNDENENDENENDENENDDDQKTNDEKIIENKFDNLANPY